MRKDGRARGCAQVVTEKVGRVGTGRLGTADALDEMFAQARACAQTPASAS